MELLRLRDASSLEVAAGWLSRWQTFRWLDFGNGVQKLKAESLRIMVQRRIHEMRLFTDDDGRPIGIVGLSAIHRSFRTCSGWCVLGEARMAGRGFATRACRQMLDVAFRDLGVRAVSAWAVDGNAPAVRLLERLGFQPIGRQRRCHYIDGRPLDRLHFDLLAEEHARSETFGELVAGHSAGGARSRRKEA